ncbi:3-oxoacyl-(acyl-carrier-protein) reductase [Sphingobium chlorophenolicum L-1]|uniref:3-oxoacyl-(Acyl-carrier-protein) reductase n=1 Tax=Sphingobium chlorophenolicum L-1 TaxID=690566 RepID=F6EUA9_SPHCR|nr:SDR family NAD(P)-dependent oxidoreductase [Sphingobium chlorophenolicum]AEG49562.1 3-oxoacyl-(acyl-carrier-protein) reductase [Sphingobium chlorophenolicum L-1]
MAASIAGKRVVITGGARGIGGDTVRYFAHHGAKVVAFDIRDEEGEALAKEATSQGPGSVVYRRVDITSIPEINAGVEFAVEQLGGLDAVFNIAGAYPFAPAEAIPEADWDVVLAVNVKGLHYVCAAAFPHLKAAGGGVIMNMAADAGILDDPIHSCAYSASKGAVHSYSRTLAKEWAKHNIRVNSVNPTMATMAEIDTLAKMTPEEQSEFRRKIQDAIPLGGKMGDTYRDLAPVLAFLASDDSRFITSQMIPVNGGLAYTR